MNSAFTAGFAVRLSHPDTPGGVTTLTVAKAGQEPVPEELPWQDAVVANLENFADAVAGRRPYLGPTRSLSETSLSSKPSSGLRRPNRQP